MTDKVKQEICELNELEIFNALKDVACSLIASGHYNHDIESERLVRLMYDSRVILNSITHETRVRFIDGL